MELEYTYWK